MSMAPFVAFDGALLSLDLDGDPYRETEVLGPWKMTRCCGAAASASDPEFGIYCKCCFGPASNDAPARLPATARFPSLSDAKRAMWRRGYGDAQQSRPMALRWSRGGPMAHAYGMGYFHGRAHPA